MAMVLCRRRLGHHPGRPRAGIATVVANLSAACEMLYRNFAGSRIVLHAPDFPELSQAIERSVRDEELFGYELLRKKSANRRVKSTRIYLRITVGMNLVNSPVMHCFFDVWHSGHQSPIYDHGDSFAVYQETTPTILTAFKVLANQQGRPATLKKDDVTSISNDSYQVHQLRNKSDQLCCTIQCCQYGKDDKIHYEGF
ncbi:hypothetical protein BDN70DRAFT_719728 [Pholiota conissans]|uniref:Uncharacterized protein n=1 Tax=Pholiota conissans TaxID=109636 RepID=A0A9P6CRR4_9AGAR|nr:hypothetical protein BDN70DRAFT_719728 [Pholiota conissans]